MSPDWVLLLSHNLENTIRVIAISSVIKSLLRLFYLRSRIEYLFNFINFSLWFF